MPITVAHEPSFLITGDYAYRAARQQAQNRLAAQQAAIAQKEADRQADVFNNIIDNQAALQESREKAQVDLQGKKLDQEFKTAETANRDAFTMQRDKNLAASRVDLQQQQFQIQGVQQLEGQVKDATKALSQQQLTPEGKVVQGKLMGNLRAIQKQRTLLPPQKYGELLGKWMEEVDSSGLEAHTIKIPSIEETIKAETFEDEKGRVWSRKKSAQTGEYELKLESDGAKEANPQNEYWGKEYNGVPEHNIPDNVYFQDPKKRNELYKSAKDALVAKAQEEMEKANEGKKEGDTPVTAKLPTTSEIFAEMRRQREEERKFMREMEEEQKKIDLELQKEMAKEMQGLGGSGSDAMSTSGFSPEAIPGDDTPTPEVPVEVPKPAPGKPAVAPPEVPVEPGLKPEGMTVRNKDGSTTTFATPEDLKKAAQAVGGVMGMIMELGAKEMVKKGKTATNGSVPAKKDRQNGEMKDWLASQGLVDDTGMSDRDWAILPSDAAQQAVNGIKSRQGNAQAQGVASAKGTMEKYESILPKGAMKQFEAGLKDEKSREAFDSSPAGRMAFNLHAYESKEQYGIDQKELIKPMPTDKSKLKLEPGDIYYVPDPQKPNVMHDAIWDGKKFRILESHEYESATGEQQ